MGRVAWGFVFQVRVCLSVWIIHLCQRFVLFKSCVFVCVCVREREREGERSGMNYEIPWACMIAFLQRTTAEEMERKESALQGQISHLTQLLKEARQPVSFLLGFTVDLNIIHSKEKDWVWHKTGLNPLHFMWYKVCLALLGSISKWHQFPNDCSLPVQHQQ